MVYSLFHLRDGVDVAGAASPGRTDFSVLDTDDVTPLQEPAQGAVRDDPPTVWGEVLEVQSNELSARASVKRVMVSMTSRSRSEARSEVVTSVPRLSRHRPLTCGYVPCCSGQPAAEACVQPPKTTASPNRGSNTFTHTPANPSVEGRRLTRRHRGSGSGCGVLDGGPPAT